MNSCICHNFPTSNNLITNVVISKNNSKTEQNFKLNHEVSNDMSICLLFFFFFFFWKWFEGSFYCSRMPFFLEHFVAYKLHTLSSPNEPKHLLLRLCCMTRAPRDQKRGCTRCLWLLPMRPTRFIARTRCGTIDNKTAIIITTITTTIIIITIIIIINFGIITNMLRPKCIGLIPTGKTPRRV